MLDIDELRAAFSLGDQLGEKIRSFRLDRANMILNRQLSVSLSESAKCVLHILPLVSFRTGFRVDLREALNTGTSDMIPMSASNCSRHFNYDGLLTYSDPGSRDYTYLQLFRNGCVEAVESEIVIMNHDKILQSFVRKNELVECGNRVLRLLAKLDVEPPYVVALSVLRIRGYRVWLHPQKPLHAHPIERDNLFLDEIVIEQATGDLADFLKPSFHQIWNACGFAESS